MDNLLALVPIELADGFVCENDLHLLLFATQDLHWTEVSQGAKPPVRFEGLGVANVKQPAADAKHMPVSDLKPKGELKKFWVDFALNLQVPQGPEEQLPDRYLNPTSRENYIERHLTVLPMTEYSFYDSFGPDENPVDFVMKQMAAVYPEVYQEWPDKRSDEALTRFCLYGIGAQRTNMLSGLPVMDAFERYGGDAYFDEQWRPVKIVDAGLSPPNAAWDSQAPVVTQPGDEGREPVLSPAGNRREAEGTRRWERAKFRFRSSLFSLVTLVDHLYGIHLQTANLFVTALREQMSPEHPIRRFLTPFTYQTIAVNDNAAHNLTAPRSMGPRCFAFTERGLALAFAAAPNLLVNGQAVPEKEGGPNLKDYVAYLKGKGIDTEYWRQAMELHGIFETFLDEYLACYYPNKEDVAVSRGFFFTSGPNPRSREDLLTDTELMKFANQFFMKLEGVTPESLSHKAVPFTSDAKAKWIATVMWTVTAGHEQEGAVEVYAQDVSWTAFKIGTKQTATSQALLMSFTSTPMPKLLGDDWTHLFPKPKDTSKDPAAAFRRFQENLKAMAERDLDLKITTEWVSRGVQSPTGR
eukprot:g14142.t1